MQTSFSNGKQGVFQHILKYLWNTFLQPLDGFTTLVFMEDLLIEQHIKHWKH